MNYIETVLKTHKIERGELLAFLEKNRGGKLAQAADENDTRQH